MMDAPLPGPVLDRAGIGDDDVEGPALGEIGHAGGHRRLVADVAGRAGVRVAGADRRVQDRAVAPDDRDARALSLQRRRDGAPETASAARDQRVPSCQDHSERPPAVMNIF